MHRPDPDQLHYPTAALILEVVSPGDESWEKLPFYAEHDVDEILIVDPAERTVAWLALRKGGYHPIERNRLVELGPVALNEGVDWPPTIA